MIAKTQPLVVAWLATLIVTAAARYVPGIRLSDEQALYLAGALFTVATAVVHRYVTPTARPRTDDGVPLVPSREVERARLAEEIAEAPPSRISQERPPHKPPVPPIGG